MTEIPDTLQTMAEIALGLAGFSGLVVVLRRNAGPLDDIHKYRLGVLFSLAFGAMFLALMPELFVNLGATVAGAWRLSAGAFSVYSIFFLWWWIVPARRISKKAPEIFNWSAFNAMLSGHIVVLALLGTLAAGIFTDSAPGIYTLGLTWYLVHTAQQFMRMLFIAPRNTE